MEVGTLSRPSSPHPKDPLQQCVDTGFASMNDSCLLSAPQSPTAAAAPSSYLDEAQDEQSSAEEEPICRYCFETETEEGDSMVSPCSCKGGQKHCHLSCLRRWQRSVLVTQPTHPAFYERDERQFVCSVCASPFAYPPPTRQEMMLSFTGPELAGLLQVGCLIVTEPRTSQQMQTTLMYNSHIPAIATMRNWIGGVYLITEIVPESASDGDDAIIAVNISGRAIHDLPETLQQRVDSIMLESSAIVGRRVTLTGLRITRGNGLRLTRHNGARGKIVGRLQSGRLRVMLDNNPRTILNVKPENLTFEGEDPPNAVIHHNIGGPCEVYHPNGLSILTHTSPEELEDTNVNVGLQHGGLCCTGSLADVLAVAREDATRRAKAMASASTSFNDDNTIADAHVENSRNSAEASSENEGEEEDEQDSTSSASDPVVSTYWGDARWSRTQLLGELARGSWGVCRAELADVILAHDDMANSEHNLWQRLVDSDRLVYAPRSEMMDDFHDDDEFDDDNMNVDDDREDDDTQDQIAALRQELRARLLAQQASEEERRRRVAAEDQANSESQV